MQHHIGGEAAKSRTSRSSRSSSVGSDAVPSPIVTSLKPVPAAKPRPAYVAVAAASELVTANRQLALEEDAYDLTSPPSPGPIDNATFSEAGLAMVNAFLDQLLYNFLFHARTTTLPALRQSVEQVLKGKLAAYAIASADEELEELLNEELDEDLAAVYESASGTSKGDVEAIFWRTRLRVMVYMRLGEMEDEDEEQHVDDAQLLLQKGSDKKRLSLTTGLVSWAAAIFLTSILEFVAEQCLNAAGQAAFDRVAAKKRGKGGQMNDEEEVVVVEEHDTERVALSSTLGRLWRTWRKGLRTPHSRNISISSSRKPSMGAIYSDNPSRPSADGGNILSRLAMQNSAGIMRGSNALDEGARLNAVRISRIAQRPRSLLIESTRITSDRQHSRPLSTSDPLQQTSTGRKRARSLPNPDRIPFTPIADLPPSTDRRPSTSPKTAEGTPSVSNLEQTPLPMHGTVSDGRATEQDISEPRARSSQNTFEAEQKSPNSRDRAVTTRKPVPNRQESVPQNIGVAPAVVGEQASPVSTESLTSIDEDFESQGAGSTEATDLSTNVTTNGLGIHSDGPASRAIPLQTADDVSPPDSPPPTHVQPRSPQYHDQHIIRAVSSFEREEKSSVRRLSNGSSQRSKSIGATRITPKRSQEAVGSPRSAATSRSSHFEKGFQEFMAGEETVKYTLTPRTLQEIESPYSPRYKVQETGRVSSDGRKIQQAPDSNLAAAQRAVIESMNASLRNFPPSGGRSRSGSANVYTSQDSSMPPVPPIPPEASANNWATQKSASTRGSRAEVDMANHGRTSSSQQKSPPQAMPSTGWFSARTSGEVTRSAKSNGATSGRSVQGSAAAGNQNVMLQPREAIVGRRGENADLVEFLRSTGPPGPQLYAGPNGRYPESNTVSSANRTSSSATRSVNGSVNSHSRLIGANGTGASGGWSSSGRGGGNDAEGAAPARTRRRVKDPYALPSDDEDEEGLTALPTRGESLVEFLRNVQPPSSMMSSGNATASPTRAAVGEVQDAKSQNGSWGSDRPSTPGSLGASRALKGKGSVKSLWKKIGA